MSDCFDHMCEALDGRWDDSEPPSYSRSFYNGSYKDNQPDATIVNFTVHATTVKAVLISGTMKINNSPDTYLEERWIPKKMVYTDHVIGKVIPGQDLNLKIWLAKIIFAEES